MIERFQSALPWLVSAASLIGAHQSVWLGATSSSHLGERPGIYAQAHAGPLSLSYSSADKIESLAGYAITAAVEPRVAGQLRGYAGATYRNGGPWSKRAYWLGGSYTLGPVRLLAAKAVGSRNRETKIEARLRLGQRPGIEVGLGVERHLQGTGVYAIGAVGLAAAHNRGQR